jgi:hypothetical protein
LVSPYGSHGTGTLFAVIRAKVSISAAALAVSYEYLSRARSVGESPDAQLVALVKGIWVPSAHSLPDRHLHRDPGTGTTHPPGYLVTLPIT